MTRTVNTGFLIVGGFLLVVVVPIAYDPFSFKPFLWSKLITVQIGTVVLLCPFFFSFLRVRSTHTTYVLDVPSVLFLLVSLASLTIAINSFKSSLEAAKLISMFGVYFAVSRTMAKTHLCAVVYGIAVITCMISGLGIAQYLRLGFMWIPSGAYPSATFLFRNSAAMYLVGALPIASIPFFLAKGFLPSLMWGMVASLPSIFLIYTRTRGAWVGIIGAAVIVGTIAGYLGRKQKLLFLGAGSSLIDLSKTLAGVCCLIVIISAVQISPIDDELQYKTSIATTALSVISQEEVQGSNRMVVWNQTIEMIRDHWMTGAGLGNWELLYPRYTKGEKIRPGWVHLRPHNDYLWIASESGLVGLTIFLWLLLAALSKLLRLVKLEKNSLCGLVSIAAATSILAISGHSLFSFPKERIPPTLFLWGQFGFIAAMASWRRAGQGRTIHHVPRQLSVHIVAIGVLAAMFPVSDAFVSDRARFDMIAASDRKDWEDVRVHAERSIGRGVQDYRIFLQKAQACLEIGDVEAALEANKVCLRFHPNSVAAYQNIGKLAAMLGKTKESMSAYDRALDLDPNNGWLFHDRGLIHARLGETERAFRDYSEAIELGGDSAILRFNRAGLYRKQGILDSALSDYHATIVKDSSFYRAYVALGELYLANGSWDRAEAAFSRAVGLNYDIPEPFYNLGHIYFLRNDRENAFRSYRRFLELWKGDPQTAAEVSGRLELLKRNP